MTVAPLPGAGVIVPMVTPLTLDGFVDCSSIDSLVEYLVGAGVTGLLVLGSSGENGALATAGREKAVEQVVAATAGRVHVLVGVAALGTNDAVEYARRFEALGADSLLVPPPFVFSPSEDEMRAHFRAVAGAVAVPVVAYDVPSRTHVALSPALLAELGKEDVISGVKDSSNDLAKLRALVELTRELPSFVRYTGVEEGVEAALLSGYTAAVPGLANVFPRLFVALTRCAGAGEWHDASLLQGQVVRLLALYRAPIPLASATAQFFGGVKEALRQLGIIAHATSCRPFGQPGEEVTHHVRQFLAQSEAQQALHQDEVAVRI